MHMRLLNLDRSTDRLALFYARNPHLTDISRVDAIDGRSVDRAVMVTNNIIEANLQYSDGALGCALSHLQAWRDVVQSGQPLTVLEDDAILCSNFEDEVKRTLSLLHDDWDYVMWGYNFDAPLTFHLGAKLSQCTCMFGQDSMRMNAATFSREQPNTLLQKLLRGFGTMAYSISPRGAERLINFCLPLRPMTTVHPGLPGTIPNRRIDNMLAHAWPSMLAYVAVPPLAISENDLDASTVQVGRFEKSASTQDCFPLQAFMPIVQALGSIEGLVVGLRATHGTELSTTGLRRAGWTGFDIAIDPPKAARALVDRGVPSRFDLLYIGAGCNLHGMLSALLKEFQPRAIIMPPEKSMMAEELVGSPSRLRTRPSYALLAAAWGYSLQPIRDVPGHWLLLWTDFAEDVSNLVCDDEEELSSIYEGQDSFAGSKAEAVRLWH